MGKAAFFNRTHETKKIVKMIDDHSQNNKIIIVAGNTGIGKSAFVDKVLSEEFKDQMSIRVNICKLSNGSIDNMHYINSLYRAIVNLANKKILSTIPSPLRQGIRSFENLLSFGVDVLLDKTVGEGNTLHEPTDDRSVIRKKDYIVSVLQKNNFIVAIDNVQNIDTQSLEILDDILKQVTNTTFIFEYTTDIEIITDQLLAFYNEIKRFNALVYLFEIKRLGYSEAKKLAPSNLDEDLIKKIYQQSRGNLVRIQLADHSMGGNYDPIKVRLAQLTKDEQFLVNLLFLNGSPLRYCDMHRILIGNMNAPPFSEQKLHKCVVKLEEAKIIRFLGSGEIRIYHDSIISQLESTPISVILYSAYGVLKDYYCQEISNSNNNDAVEHLFSLLVRFSDEELLTFFPQISNLIRSYKYPCTAIYKLISFRKEIQQKGRLSPHLYVKLVTLLVNLCLEYGLWEEALSNLELIYSPKNPYHRATKALALSLDFTSDESIRDINVLIQQATSPREKLTSELCLLSAMMARQPREKSIKLAKKMLETKEYRDYVEYAYLLSNYAELINEPQECIALYKQAIKCFHYNGRDKTAANILVFLSMIYAYEGEVTVARKILDKGKSLGGIKESYFLNNYAVLDLLDGNTSENIAKQLNDALLLTCDPYEKILIQCNLLVCYTLLTEMERAKEIMLEITSQPFEQFQYEEFLHIVYQDLVYYFGIIGHSAKVQQYKQHLQRLVDNAAPNAMFVPIAKMQLRNQSSPELFFSNFPFRVDFLGSWSLEISSDLENF